MPDPDEALIEQILPVLELDHQYSRSVEAWNHDRVAQIRRCGRAAGKRLGYQVRTFASDPEQREDGRVVVWVVVTGSNPDDEARIRRRGELLISETLHQLLA
jgi:hypothetical protein